ncbi:hypothetical protein KC343_g1535 [Hortaea werneckii]|nr:hypothetical protein KC352_g15310 [Hortaea werneckii]KAI7571275.1 hypothetical protein KC317_g1760 [Hortaea werneckii]KAI7624507.1 hypothetical protein KC346_g2191 [Hortaea werneckii]KAI7635964.1 hypothetical protein KC343_g1535 [Hortaea werneckii]KAI7681294.1 hypothetical protein KC319_g1667 [Hortaea werneckii]
MDTKDEVEKRPTTGNASPRKEMVELTTRAMTKDEHHLATLGYKQVFIRSFGMFENWAATFTTMNFVSGLPVLFGFAMYTGGPQAAFSNWTMVGGLSTIVSLAMAEVAAALPTAGGIYYWAYVLGGQEYGPLLAWLTAWYNWAGWLTIVPGIAQGNTNFFVSMLEILYPNSAVLKEGWFAWCISALTIILAAIPNCVSQWTIRHMLRGTVYTTVVLMAFYFIWFPIAASRSGGFQPASIMTTFYNGINTAVDSEGNTVVQASDSYCWVVGVLFGAWPVLSTKEFYGYDASVHLSEETLSASSVVANGMWTGSISTWLLSVLTLIMVLFCMQDFMGIVNGTYPNNWAEYLVQLTGRRGAAAILAFTWIDGLLCTGVIFLSAQRITYAVARDGILPFSKTFSKVTPKHHLPVNAALLMVVLTIAICAAVIGSTVAFSAITAAATIGTNLSYLIPIVARQTIGRKHFKPAKWNLGAWSIPVSIVASLYIAFLFVVLMLPQLYPVNAQTLNYAPIVIGGITAIALGGWFFPFSLGARNWFEGPRRTITEVELVGVQVKGSD